MAVSIHIKNVMKKYDDNVVIPNLSLDIAKGELFTLLGPSGCGKTTLLRMIAGFNTIEKGTIAFDEKIINDIPVHQRNFGMVFQSYAIFPNMTVYGNIEYGLKNKHLSKEEIKKRVFEIMDTVQITPYKDRYPDKLSGGQQQRVALARAIAVRPQVLLMDEPLSNLDAKLRLEMRNVIRDIQKRVGITTVYVTHDQEEALAISDRIAIMNNGEIYQVEVPEKIYLRPYNTFVANFIGHSHCFQATVTESGEMTVIKLETGLTVILKNVKPLAVGEVVLVYVRPEEFVLCDEPQGMPGIIKSRQFLGKFINYFVDFGTKNLTEVSVNTNSANMIFSPGEKIWMRVDSERVNLFAKDSETTLMEGVQSHV
ncbi:MAG TPA: ABC transporter ATP-binding protein [Flexilinea sp.]|nr:ABC transporter ATP-binding protein [Flexilinea sp.]HPB40228.1 ABC transporter ATP-binding protein [Flexilinea sp.]